MRVGFISYSLDSGLTGIGRYMIQLMAALQKLPGIEVVLLATETTDRYQLWSRFETYHLPLCRYAPALMSWGNLAVPMTARQAKLDLVHDPNGVAPFLGPAMGARRVVTIHDAVPFRFPAQHNRLDNWRYRLMLPLAARRADAVISVSESARRDLAHFLQLPVGRIHVTGEGAGPEFALQPPEAVTATLARHGLHRPYLLYVGGLNGRKNIEGLLAAFAAARSGHPELTLVIVGKRQWGAGGIDAALQHLDVEPYVQFTGYLPDADLPALYSGAAAFVFPSLYEGFGLPVLEAMACGAPVITSNVSSLPEVAGDAALLVDPHNSVSIAAAIKRILEEPGLSDTLRSRGLARAAVFSWERTARETVAVYEQVLHSRPHSATQHPRKEVGR